MGIETPKLGLEKIDKKPKPSSITKKTTEVIGNNTNDIAKIFIKPDNKNDSANSSFQKPNKPFKVNGQSHGGKFVTKHGNSGIGDSKNDYNLLPKYETYTKARNNHNLDSGNGYIDNVNGNTNNFNKSDKDHKGDRKMRNRFDRKGKYNNKLRNGTSYKSKVSTESDNSNLHASKNHSDKSMNSNKSANVSNAINLDSDPDISILSPKSKEWVGNLFPVLECYNFTLPEILMLIKRNDYNAEKIQNAVSAIMQVQGGHEQGQWQVVGAKPTKPKEQDKAKVYHEKVNNYLKALKVQSNESNKLKQPQLKHDDKNKGFQKNGKIDSESYSISKSNEKDGLSRNRDKEYKKELPDKLSNKPFGESRDKLTPTRSVVDKSSNLSVNEKVSGEQNDSAKSKLSSSNGEVDLPKMFDLSLKTKGSNIEKDPRYRASGKLDKNYREGLFNSGSIEHSDGIENVNAADQAKLQSNATTAHGSVAYGLQQFQDVNLQPHQYQYQDYQGKSYPNYPPYAHYGYPEYPQQPMPTFQPYQDPAILASYPNFKTYQTVMPNIPKYNPNNLPMMVSNNYSAGAPNPVPNDINGSDGNLRSTVADRDYNGEKVLNEDNMSMNASQKNKIGSNSLNDEGLWREQVKNVQQSVNWKDQAIKDQKPPVESGLPVTVMNSQRHGYNGNYSIPPGLHSTSYPYSYSSFPYNHNFNGMMYGAQNPQMHSHHMMSYNQYDTSYKYMAGPPGLEPRGSHENDGKLGPLDQNNLNYNKPQVNTYGKTPYERIPNPPGLTNYYSQYQPSYGNHSGNYQNMSNWP